MKPSPAQKKLLKKLPQRRAEIAQAITRNGRLRKTYLSVQKHGWAKWNETLDELQVTFDGAMLV